MPCPAIDPSVTWEGWLGMAVKDRLRYHSTTDGRLYDILFARQFDPKTLAHLIGLADHLRSLRTDEKKSRLKSLLEHRYGILLFQQASSRTRLSFSAACMRTGLNHEVITDLSTSSFAKGESDEDSARTFSSYGTCLIVRHADETFCHRIAWDLMHAGRRCRVVNAGSGTEEHPTQALLDIYTLHNAFKGNLDGRRVALVGDLLRGRTVRSLCYLLSLYRGTEIALISPPSIAMRQDVIDHLAASGVVVHAFHDFDEGLAAFHPDAVYMTRLQKEYRPQTVPTGTIEGDLPRLLASGRIEEAQALFDAHRRHTMLRLEAEKEWETLRNRFVFRADHFDRLGPDAVVLHPLPQDKAKPDVDPGLRNHPRVLMWEQMRNGMWMRAALLLYLYARDEDALEIPADA